MANDDHSWATPEDDFVVEVVYGMDEPEEPEFEWYRPSLFARLSANKPLLVFIIVAFVLLILGPSLFYLLNPPKPRLRPLRGRGYPAMSVPASPRAAARYVLGPPAGPMPCPPKALRSAVST